MRFSSYAGRWLAVGTAVLVTWFAIGGRGLPAYRAAQESPASLTVSAAISLKDALDEIAKMYEQKNPGVKVTFNYGGSGTLQHQIEQGAPVDIFFSAAEKQMDALRGERTDRRGYAPRCRTQFTRPDRSRGGQERRRISPTS